MLLDRLVVLGRMFVDCGLSADEVLGLISDVENEGRFLENIGVIEISLNRESRVAPLPLQTWGEYKEIAISKKKKVTVFEPNVRRGLGVPFIRPRSGNPTVPQGKYGVPVYPVFPGMLEDLINTPTLFLKGRLERTKLSRKLTDQEINLIGGFISSFASEIKKRVDSGNNGGYGLIVLCIPDPSGPYHYEKKIPVPGDRLRVWIGESVLFPGSHIIGDIQALVDRFKLSKTEEGATMGKASRCSLCGKYEGEAISAYNKAWSWLAPTWHAPFPESYKQDDKVTDLASTVAALCPDCYTNMVVGAGVFSEVSGTVHQWLTKELFMPVASAGGRLEAKKARQLPITGAMVILPIVSNKGEVSEDDADAIQEGLRNYRLKRIRNDKKDCAIETITGFESTIPEELNKDNYRLSMIYFTQANADIHLRAVIDDVLPSTVARLQSVIGDVLQRVVAARQQLGLQISGGIGDRYESLPYLLIRAYGGSYLWQTLDNILHHRPFSWERFIAGVAIRMNGYARAMILGGGDPARQARQELKEEVYFYLVFRELYNAYRSQVLKEGGNDLAGWREMFERISTAPVKDLTFEGPEDLGFAAGCLVARFGRQYYAKLKKDFVQHRVMTFGANLAPDDIWRRALSRFQEYAIKLDMNLSQDFRSRAALVECEYRRLRDAVGKQKDEFMGAFWSGYMLSLSSDKDNDNENQKEEGK